jgi:hypothetical protein
MSDWFPALISGASGLSGVYLGAWLTGQREERARARDIAKRGAFLAIVISEELDRFTAGCARVVGDNGLHHGQPNEQGYREVQVEAPTFDPSAFDVDWQAIPATLTEAVLSLPARIEEARAKISDTSEYVATPPDFEEFFEERCFQYAELGLYAVRTAAALRDYAGLPVRLDRAWDVATYLTAEKADLERHRQQREHQQAKSLSALTQGN